MYIIVRIRKKYFLKINNLSSHKTTLPVPPQHHRIKSEENHIYIFLCVYTICIKSHTQETCLSYNIYLFANHFDFLIGSFFIFIMNKRKFLISFDFCIWQF